MTAWYNEPEPYVAAWLENLINEGHIAPGIVDRRDIRDVRAEDLEGFTQLHFFAGIAVWSYALRQAGWPDDRPIWTGSCPCQPFSAAGRRLGEADPRHLWPVWWPLIERRRPELVIGEQVAGKDGRAWFDLVSSDLESGTYTPGAIDTPACSVGKHHRRQRLYWMAHAANARRERRRASQTGNADHAPRREPQRLCDADWMAHASSAGWRAGSGPHSNGALGTIERGASYTDCSASRLGNAEGFSGGLPDRQIRRENSQPVGAGETVEWLPCRDGKYRPTQPGLFPLAHGLAGRVGKLRAYGNALCAPQAITFCKIVMEIMDDTHL